MISAPKHPQETERQAALERLAILDTAAEKEFDDIALIAAQICEVPIALVSLVDGERQWFKSKIGLEVSQTPRELAFCAHAILQSDVMVVDDATTDARFMDNPLVTSGPRVRFYAGAPLLSPENMPIGTLCVIDTQARALAPEKKTALAALANQLNRLLRLRIHIEQLKVAHQLLQEAKAGDERRRQLEIQLLAANKMSALGEMAAEVAHEINTPLTVIQLTAEIVKDQIGAGVRDQKPLLNNLTTIEKTITHIASIVRGLRTFSRESEGESMKLAPLNEIVNLVTDLCQQRFRASGIELKASSLPDLSLVCRRTQITQILVNLLNNAHDAVEKLEDRWVEIQAEVSGAFIKIAVVDSGRGLSPEVAAKIEKPFFTTKEIGRGTGLGLSISRTIANDHGGDLKYDATAVNTTFVLSLPYSA